MKFFVFATISLILDCAFSNNGWISDGVYKIIIEDFLENEKYGNKLPFLNGRGENMHRNFPFIDGQGFRIHCYPNICEPATMCALDPEIVKDGSCVFVQTECLFFFVHNISFQIQGRYTLVALNSDQSSPDGQDDIPYVNTPRRLKLFNTIYKFNTSHILREQYNTGKLIAFHGQNTWWYTYKIGEKRPDFVHCLPIRLDSFHATYLKVLINIVNSTDHLRKNTSIFLNHSKSNGDFTKLLLVPFHEVLYAPDRNKVLSILKKSEAMNGIWYHKVELPHMSYLHAIRSYKFVLAPFGYGLDTHRISEILLMGGRPVIRRSSLSSCYDDSDNFVNNVSRGSLPIVVLDKWEDLSVRRLEKEWKRINSKPSSAWDWQRVFIYHWLQRIGTGTNENITKILNITRS